MPRARYTRSLRVRTTIHRPGRQPVTQHHSLSPFPQQAELEPARPLRQFLANDFRRTSFRADRTRLRLPFRSRPVQASGLIHSHDHLRHRRSHLPRRVRTWHHSYTRYGTTTSTFFPPTLKSRVSRVTST